MSAFWLIGLGCFLSAVLGIQHHLKRWLNFPPQETSASEFVEVHTEPRILWVALCYGAEQIFSTVKGWLGIRQKFWLRFATCDAGNLCVRFEGECSLVERANLYAFIGRETEAIAVKTRAELD